MLDMGHATAAMICCRRMAAQRAAEEMLLSAQLADSERQYNVMQRQLRELSLSSGESERREKDPKWIAWNDSCNLRQRLMSSEGIDNLPYPIFGEKPELYRQRLRKAVADRRK